METYQEYNEFSSLEEGASREQALMRELKGLTEQARQGALSPHWQRYAEGLLAQLAAKGDVPPEAAALKQQLDQLMRTRAQCSDEEAARAQLQAAGASLLYYYTSEDYWTTLEVSRVPDGYTAAVYIDREAAADDLQGYAAAMAAPFLQWVRSQLPDFAPPAPVAADDLGESKCYPTLRDAAEYVLSALQAPEQIAIGG